MTQIHICSWNIHLGLHLEKILAEIQNSKDFSNLDFLLLQEASIQNGQEDSQTISEKLGKNYSHLQSISQTIRKRPQSNAIVWNSNKFVLKTACSLPLPKYRSTALPKRENYLLKFFKPQTRTALMSEGTFGPLSIRIYSIHLDVLGWEHKTAQLLRILNEDQKLPPIDLTILGGDFNTLSIARRPHFKSFHKLIADHEFKDISTEVKYTFSRRLTRRQKLDFILLRASPAVRYTYKIWTLPTKSSDHLPVFTEIRLES